jgi:hypothetical protein
MMHLKASISLCSILFGSILTTADARSPIGYDAVIVLMSIELLFAFGVGLACILFSLNIFTALRATEDNRSLHVGDLPKPPRKPAYRSRYHTGDVLMGRFVSIHAPVYEEVRSDMEISAALEDAEATPADAVDEAQSTADATRPATAPVHEDFYGLWSTIRSFVDYVRIW